MPIVLRRWFQVVAPIAALAVLPSSPSLGWCPVDGHTRYMWAHTWYGPNALETPLTDYFIPRIPGQCNAHRYAAGPACQNGAPETGPNQYGAYQYPTAATTSFEPTQFERLGKIPNELELGGAGFPAGGPMPAPVPRR
jgi:hypothetical protein